MTHPQDTNHTAFDIGAIVLLLGSFAGYLPAVAAGLAALWYCILIYDRFFHKKKTGAPE